MTSKMFIFIYKIDSYKRRAMMERSNQTGGLIASRGWCKPGGKHW